MMLTTFISRFIDLFCRVSFDKTGAVLTEKSSKSKRQAHKDDQGVFCAACRILLSRHDQAIEFAGGHRHCFLNPFGFEFEIALYREVACQPDGPLTLEHTWFAGYAWQNVLCAGCHLQLGWRYYRADSPGFYGLITDRIVEK